MRIFLTLDDEIYASPPMRQPAHHRSSQCHREASGGVRATPLTARRAFGARVARMSAISSWVSVSMPIRVLRAALTLISSSSFA